MSDSQVQQQQHQQEHPPCFEDEPEEVGIEVVGVPPKSTTTKKKKQHQKRLPSPIHQQHKAGDILEPPPAPLWQTVPPAFRRTSNIVGEDNVVDPTEPITYIEGDPIPPCFRVVGVEQQQQQTKKKPKLKRLLQLPPNKTTAAVAPPSRRPRVNPDYSCPGNGGNLNHSILIDNTDTDTDDDESVQFEKTRQQFLQLDVENMGKQQMKQPRGESPPEIFEDEDTPSLLDLADNDDGDASSCGQNATPTLTDSSRCSKYSRKDYLEITQRLMAQRKRELQKQQQASTKKPYSTADISSFTKCVAGMALLVGIGLAVVIALVIVNANGSDTEPTAAAAVQSDEAQQDATPLTIPPGAELYEPLTLADLPPYTQLVLSMKDDDDDASLPQAKAFAWLQRDPLVQTYPHWRQRQRMALATLYYSTNGDQWTHNHAKQWLSYDLSECQWYPQACDGNDKVRRLLLSDSHLDGTLPPELFWLTHLQQVQLMDNPHLRGSIPTEIGQWTQLQVLWMPRCGLSSSSTNRPALPTEIGLLQELLYLDLSENPLLGRLNQTGDAALPLLDSNNDASSSVRDFQTPKQDLPTELGQLTKLQELILHQTGLVGTIPSELGQLTALQGSLQLNFNALTGSLPREMGQWTQLQQFLASDNHLSGNLPTAIGGMTQLQVLDVSVNHLEGSLPMYISLCESLQEIWLYDNMITGTIPQQLNYLAKTLVSLDLSMNQLRSTLPRELGQLTELTGLWVYQNMLTGEIPSELGNVHAKLLQLSLFGNQLGGRIPSDLNRLTQLRGLWLDENALTGMIPWGLLESTSLIALHLFDNRLDGRIPNSMSDQSVLQELLLHKNRLWGSVPQELAELSSLVQLSLEENEFTGVIPRELCETKEASEDFLAISIDCNEVGCSCDCQCPDN